MSLILLLPKCPRLTTSSGLAFGVGGTIQRLKFISSSLQSPHKTSQQLSEHVVRNQAAQVTTAFTRSKCQRAAHSRQTFSALQEGMQGCLMTWLRRKLQPHSWSPLLSIMKELHSGCLGEWFLDGADPCPMLRDSLRNAFALVCTTMLQEGMKAEISAFPGTGSSATAWHYSLLLQARMFLDFCLCPRLPFPLSRMATPVFLFNASAQAASQEAQPQSETVESHVLLGKKSYWSICCCPVMPRSNFRRKVLSVGFKSAKWAMAARI